MYERQYREELLRNLEVVNRERPISVFVLGETDTGKTTLVSDIAKRLAKQREVWRIDADPGQSALGPPGTVGGQALARGATRLRFVGGTSPVRHLLQLTCGVASLCRAARRGDPECGVVVDSCGFVAGPVAEEFQYSLIDLVRPDILIFLDRGSAVYRITASFSGQGGPKILRTPPSRSVRKRTQEERGHYRKRRLAHYFSKTREVTVSLGSRGLHGHVPRKHAAGGYDSGWQNRVVGFLDSDQWLMSLAVVEEATPGEHLSGLELRARIPEAHQEAPEVASSIQVGSMKLQGLDDSGDRLRTSNSHGSTDTVRDFGSQEVRT